MWLCERIDCTLNRTQNRPLSWKLPNHYVAIQTCVRHSFLYSERLCRKTRIFGFGWRGGFSWLSLNLASTLCIGRPRHGTAPVWTDKDTKHAFACCAGGMKARGDNASLFSFCSLSNPWLTLVQIYSVARSRLPWVVLTPLLSCTVPFLAYFVLLSLLTAHHPPAWLHLLSLLAGGGWGGWGGGSTSCSGIRTDTRPWPISPNNLAHVKSTLK